MCVPEQCPSPCSPTPRTVHQYAPSADQSNASDESPTPQTRSTSAASGQDQQVQDHRATSATPHQTRPTQPPTLSPPQHPRQGSGQHSRQCGRSRVHPHRPSSVTDARMLTDMAVMPLAGMGVGRVCSFSCFDVLRPTLVSDDRNGNAIPVLVLRVHDFSLLYVVGWIGTGRDMPIVKAPNPEVKGRRRGICVLVPFADSHGPQSSCVRFSKGCLFAIGGRVHPTYLVPRNHSKGVRELARPLRRQQLKRTHALWN
jgi:hypothetical protein